MVAGHDLPAFDLDHAERLADRRQWLSHHTPACPACNEAQQIQITVWTDLRAPPQWRCRTCGHRWTEDPAAATLSQHPQADLVSP